MVTRLYNLIALFIVAPSPISQIVLDDGAKFKSWKDKVLQEAFKVVGCVMSFMIFVMIISVVNSIDLMQYAYTQDAGTAISLLEDNSGMISLNKDISSMYYGENGDSSGHWINAAINALGRCMIIIAGVGAIRDMDETITPLLAGGSSSMESKYTGQALSKAGATAAKAALGIGKAAIGGALNMAASGISGLAGAGLSLAEGIGDAVDAGRSINAARETDPGAPTPGGPGTPTPGGPGTPEPGGPETPEEAGTPEPAGAETPEEAGTPEPAGAEIPEEAGTPEPAGAEAPEEAGTPGEHTSSSDAPEDKDSIKEKFETSKKNLQDAKNNLKDAKERDAKKNEILENMEAIENSKSMSDEEKAERLAKLDEEFNNVDAEGPSLTDAQKEYDSAKASYEMDKRDYDRTHEEDKPDGGSSESVESAESVGSRDPRFDSMHDHGKLGLGGKIVKGALAFTGGVAHGATRSAFKIAGETLKTGAKVTGTAAKTGLSIAGILAKSVLTMTGMGGVASAAGDFVGGVVGDTVKATKGLGKDLKTRGSKFLKKNMKMVDGNGNSVNKDGYRLDKDGNVMKDKDGNKIKGEGDPTYVSSLGSVLGATGDAFSAAGRGISGAAQNAVPGLFRWASAHADTASRNHVRLARERRERLSEMETSGSDRVRDINNIVNGSDFAATDVDVSSGAEEAVGGANQQLSDAYDMNNILEQLSGERDDQLDVNDEDVERINAAYAAQDVKEEPEDPEVVARRQRLSAIAGGTDDANARKRELTEHMRDVVAPNYKRHKHGEDSPFISMGTKDKPEGSPFRSKQWKERSQYLHALYFKSQDLEKYYGDVLEKVNSGEPMDADTVEKYSEYLDTARKLDNAYMYVHSGYGRGGQGQEDFEAMEHELKHGIDGGEGDINPEYAARKGVGYDEQQHFKDIMYRSDDMAGLGGHAKRVIPPKPPKPTTTDPTTIMDKASAATNLKAATIRADQARAEYDRLSAEGSGATDKEIDDARSKVQTAVGDVARYSDQVRDHAGSARKGIISSSKRNEQRNVGNENYERARNKARVQVNKAKAKGGVAGKLAGAMERSIDDLESKAESSSSANAHGDRGRKRKKVTATLRMGAAAMGARILSGEPISGGTPVGSNGRRSQARTQSTDTPELDIDLNVIQEEQIQQGVGSDSLVEMRNAYADYVEKSTRTEWSGVRSGADEFMRRVAATDVSRQFQDQRLSDAIKGVKREQVPKSFNGSTAEYRKQAESRYKNAVANYNNNMKIAQQLSTEYATNSNPETLRSVQEAIQIALRASEEIRDLKVELKIDDDE